MYFKHELIRYQKDIDLGDTFKFDELPEKGKSSGLIIWIRTPLTSGAHYTYDGKTRLVDFIDKVQVVADGKRPLKDLTGPQVQALNFYNTGEVAADVLTDPCLGPQYCQLVMPWGRRLYDPEFYLDWENYSSIELDITNSLTAALHTSAVVTIENIKIMDDEALPPSKGIFQERNWREWATAQGATKYLKPPAANKYRRIMLQATPAITSSAPYRRKRSFFHLMEEIKLGFSDYAEICFDGYGRYLLYRNASEFPHIAETMGKHACVTGGDMHTNTGIGYRLDSHATSGEITTAYTDRVYAIYTYNDDLMVVFTNATSQEYFDWTAKGLGYQNTMLLKFDHIDQPEYYLDAPAKAPLNLDIKTEDHADAAGGTNSVVLCELVEK